MAEEYRKREWPEESKFIWEETPEGPPPWWLTEGVGPDLEDILPVLREAGRMADMAVEDTGPRHMELLDFSVEINKQSALTWCIEFECTGRLRDLMKQARRWAEETGNYALAEQIKKVYKMSKKVCRYWICGRSEKGREDWDRILVAFIR